MLPHIRLPHLRVDRRSLRTGLILAAMLAAGTFYNLVLMPNHPPGSPYAALRMNPEIVESVARALSTKWTALLLPFEYETGRFYWCPTVIFIFYAAQKYIGGIATFAVFYNLFLATTFACCLRLTRSPGFALITTFLFAFGTQLDYLFTFGNLVALFLVMTYVAVNFTWLILYLRDDTTSLRYFALFAGSLTVAALSNENWINYATGLICATVFGIFWARRQMESALSWRCAHVLGTVLAVLGAYLAVRLQVARQYVTPGAEEELLITYPQWSLLFDDLIANYFTFLYMSISNYLPSFLASSNALTMLPPAEIIASQHGYHPQSQHLILMNHLFLWRFHAGVLVTLFFAGLAWTARKSWSWEPGNVGAAIVVALGLMVISGFSTHLMIKMRPYNSAPALAYKALMSVSAWTVLVAYVAWSASETFARWRGWIVGGLLAVVLVASFTRPRMHAHIMVQLGVSGYADPLPRLYRLWR
jgi:hypothetical protein